jgi:cytochrome P450
MAALTLTGTTRALFGLILGEEVWEIGEMVNQAVAFLEKPSDPRAKLSMSQLDEVVFRIIKQRRDDFKDGDDLLSLMMLARDNETGKGISDVQLRDQIMTLMLAGYETTASALAWTWYLLSQNAPVAKVLRAEARQVLAGRPPQYSDLEHLPYTHQVLNESLRMFPPACILGRRALREDEIGGFYIAPGSVLAICIYTLHRHPEFWKQPEVFDPNRFTPGNNAQRHRFAFTPLEPARNVRMSLHP